MSEPPKSGSRGRARCAAVLDAAACLFLEQGFEQTTLDQVIAKAGGSRRTIYEQFGNKEGLFAAVVRERSQLMLAPLHEMEMQGRSPEETLVAFGLALLDTLVSQGVVRVLRLVLAEAPRFPELGAAYYESGPGATRRELADYFRRLSQSGRLRVDDPAAAANQFLGLVISNLHIRSMIYPDRVPAPAEMDAHVRQAVKTFLYGVTGNAL